MAYPFPWISAQTANSGGLERPCMCPGVVFPGLLLSGTAGRGGFSPEKDDLAGCRVISHLVTTAGKECRPTGRDEGCHVRPRGAIPLPSVPQPAACVLPSVEHGNLVHA